MWHFGQQTPKVGPKKAEEIYRRLQDHGEKYEENLARLKVERITEETAECHFQPELFTKSKKDKKVVELHNRVDQILKERQDNVAKIKRDEAMQREENFKDQCTFQPRINREATPSKVKQKVADIEAWKKKIQDKLFEEYFDNTKKEEASFRPSISQKSLDIIRAKTPDGARVKVEDRLFGLSKQKKDASSNAESQKYLPPRNSQLSKSQTFQSLKPSHDERKMSSRRPSIKIIEPTTPSRQRVSSRPSMRIITVDQLCSHHASTISNFHASSTISALPQTKPQQQNSGREIGMRKNSNREADKENARPLPSPIKPQKQQQGSFRQTIEDSPDKNSVMDQDDKNLLNKLKANTSNLSFDSDHMTSVFRDLLGNCGNRKTGDYLPKDKVKTKKDGRHYMKIDDTKIFYQDEDLSQIINFSLRSRIHLA